MWIMDENKEIGKFLHLTFEKLERYNWWASSFKGDPLIDTTKINPEATTISECDESMRPQCNNIIQLIYLFIFKKYSGESNV